MHGAQLHVYKSLTMANKVEETVAVAKEALADGFAVVIGLQTTGCAAAHPPSRVVMVAHSHLTLPDRQYAHRDKSPIIWRSNEGASADSISHRPVLLCCFLLAVAGRLTL